MAKRKNLPAPTGSKQVSWAKKEESHQKRLTQSFTGEKKELDFSLHSGEATSDENKIPHESRVACHE